jgi:hypothetical protein
MALTKAQREELNAYKEALREEIRAEIRQEVAGPQPQLPDIPELDLADVIRILIQHSRVPTEALQLAMLEAVDRAFTEAEADEVEDAPADEVIA